VSDMVAGSRIRRGVRPWRARSEPGGLLRFFDN